MKLYNTLSKKLEDVSPIDGKEVRIYSCGPTLYDRIHIGNISSFIFADTLRRAAKFSGFKVRQVMNFTDVDDKTIKRSMELGLKDPRSALQNVTKKYELLFLDDVKSVGNADAEFVHATDFIKEMQDLITELYRSKIAYAAKDGVYFSIANYVASGREYGQLLKLNSSSTAESRIDNDEYDKDSAHDFALWKTQKAGEPSWKFTLDGKKLDGRPGWHIECSAMSRAKLGQPFDIHTGGIDLIFPHHENEIAQSTAASEDSVLATLFVHNEHLLIDGRKMSKSLNNFYTLEDIRKRGFEPVAFRLLVLQSHYRSQLNFTWTSLEAAQNRLNNLRAWADLVHQSTENSTSNKLAEQIEKTVIAMAEATSNDLNTPSALAALSALVEQTYLQQNVRSINTDKFKELLECLDQLFGLGLSGRPDITDDQKNLIEKREIARKTNNWDESDMLRQQLTQSGLSVNDTACGAIWSRI